MLKLYGKRTHEIEMDLGAPALRSSPAATTRSPLRSEMNDEDMIPFKRSKYTAETQQTRSINISLFPSVPAPTDINVNSLLPSHHRKPKHSGGLTPTGITSEASEADNDRDSSERETTDQPESFAQSSQSGLLPINERPEDQVNRRQGSARKAVKLASPVGPAMRLFTEEQVREMIQAAVSERESQLRVEYDRILSERLAEQYRSFVRFNEDYISRQYKSSELSYLS